MNLGRVLDDEAFHIFKSPLENAASESYLLCIERFSKPLQIQMDFRSIKTYKYNVNSFHMCSCVMKI